MAEHVGSTDHINPPPAYNGDRAGHGGRQGLEQRENPAHTVSRDVCAENRSLRATSRIDSADHIQRIPGEA